MAPHPWAGLGGSHPQFLMELKGCFSRQRRRLNPENAPRNQIIPKGQGPETAVLGLYWACEATAYSSSVPAIQVRQGGGRDGAQRPHGAYCGWWCCPLESS